jgi:hypothetical protein
VRQKNAELKKKREKIKIGKPYLMRYNFITHLLI